MSKSIHLLSFLTVFCLFNLHAASALLADTATLVQARQPAGDDALLHYAAADTIELEQIVVTASKIPLSLRESTKPVLIIDRRQIEQNGSRNLGQLLNQQSGIRINDAFGSPANAQTLFMQGASGPSTLILVNGQPISDPSGTGGTYDLRLLPVNNIERIEILNGSQSTLYGTDAIAGVVNILTRSGDEGPVNARGQLSYGSYNSFDGLLSVNGTVDRRHSYTLNYQRRSSDGFSAAAKPNGSDTFGDDGFNSNSFFGKADISVTDEFEVSPFYHYNAFDGDFDAGAFQDADNTFSLNMFHTGLQAAFRRDRLNIHGSYSLTSTERTFSDQFGGSSFEGVFHNSDLFGSYAARPWLSVLGGFNFQQSSIPASGDADELSAQISSPYATMIVKGVHGLSAELGYRANIHSEYGYNGTYSFAPAYHISENVKLFGSLTTGFKVPTLNELFGPFGANPELDPESSRYVSFGLETFLLEQSMKLRAQYFNREIDDVIVFTFFDGFVNRDRQSDYGVELYANWLASGRIKVSGHYNYTDGELITTDEAGEELRQNNLLRRPAHNVGLQVGVNVTEQLFIRLDGEYNSSRTDLFFNPDNNFTSEEVNLDPYTLINLYTEYHFPEFRAIIFADFRNVLDSSFTEIYGFNTAGFTLEGGFRFQF